MEVIFLRIGGIKVFSGSIKKLSRSMFPQLYIEHNAVLLLKVFFFEDIFDPALATAVSYRFDAASVPAY